MAKKPPLKTAKKAPGKGPGKGKAEGREKPAALDADKIVEAMLPHVPFDGWTAKALTAGVEDAGFDPSAAPLAFPGGMAEVAEHFSALADRRMMAELERRKVGERPVRERISLAVRVRLEQNAQNREALRHLLSYLALPTNAPVALKCLYRTVDAMWHAAGDTATDFNFYTKRATLAGVFGATVLYWLNDTSEGFEKTFAFLDRRIENAMTIGKAGGRLGAILAGIPTPFGRRPGPPGGGA
ncbi:MAG: COQ9 family protein [Proteobacteria bacterium]|nr:COQ9 family protein [Pseudomonadota bacterium]